MPIYDLVKPIPSLYDAFPVVKVNRDPIDFNVTPFQKTDRFLEMAMGVALTSKCRMKHGALVVKHGRILGSACNVQKNSPRYVNHEFSSIHAEIQALRKAGWPRKCTVYVARVNSHGEARLSKPCANCQAVLDELRSKVVYTKLRKRT